MPFLLEFKALRERRRGGMCEEMHIFIHWLLPYSGAMIPLCQACFNFSGNWLCGSKWRQIEDKNRVQRHEGFLWPRGVRRSQRRFQSHRQGQLTLRKINLSLLREKERRKKLNPCFLVFSFWFSFLFFSFFPWVINSKRKFWLHQHLSKQKVGISSSESYQLLTFRKCLV